jgi:hypothetical protein
MLLLRFGATHVWLFQRYFVEEKLRAQEHQKVTHVHRRWWGGKGYGSDESQLRKGREGEGLT